MDEYEKTRVRCRQGIFYCLKGGFEGNGRCLLQVSQLVFLHIVMNLCFNDGIHLKREIIRRQITALSMFFVVTLNYGRCCLLFGSREGGTILFYALQQAVLLQVVGDQLCTLCDDGRSRG